ncbi:MAG TPA: 16S rRNA (guanine(966)-N(2))-methyltransferase RsmD [Balneolaceae bacterium]|nr:16S rRNA (guanine(966)-N(2))-methyltransferase RsmD [Balneolaceae bacterium]
MRIITGTLKGRQINIPNTLNVRPTSDRTKEGLFSILDARKYIQNTRVLDLFAGSGNLGLEAISRGAEKVQFVDRDRRNLDHIDKVAREFEVEDRVQTVPAKAERFLDAAPLPYDIIFADPPYDYPLMNELVANITQGGWLAESGWLILEHDKRHDFSDNPHFAYYKEYGRTHVSIFTEEAGIKF